MTKSLAQLRAEKPTARPERALTICLAQDKVAELQALTAELATLPGPRAAEVGDDGESKAPTRMVERPEVAEGRARAEKIGDRLRALIAEMAEDEGELRVRAGDDGDWRRWVNEHPARSAPVAATDETPATEGEPGWARDLEVASGYCNADDLIDDLGKYAHSWAGDELDDGDWAVLAANIAPPDLKEIARAVVAMHESRLDFRQWRTRWSAALTKSDDSKQPATPASAPAASSAGSRARSSAATTKKATASRSPRRGK